MLELGERGRLGSAVRTAGAVVFGQDEGVAAALATIVLQLEAQPAWEAELRVG